MQFFYTEEIEYPKVIRVILIILLPICFILGIVVVMILFAIMIGVGVFVGMFAIVGGCCKHLCCFALLLAPIGMVGGALAMPFYFTIQVSIPVFRTYLRRYMITIRMLNYPRYHNRLNPRQQQPLHNHNILV
jgi:hypothetical protein